MYGDKQLQIPEHMLRQISQISSSDISHLYIRFHINEDDKFKYLTLFKFYSILNLPPLWEKLTTQINTYYYSLDYNIVSEVHPADCYIISIIDHIKESGSYIKDNPTNKEPQIQNSSTKIYAKLEDKFIKALNEYVSHGQSNKPSANELLYKENCEIVSDIEILLIAYQLGVNFELEPQMLPLIEDCLLYTSPSPRDS